jgi:hypothetical protein
MLVSRFTLTPSRIESFKTAVPVKPSLVLLEFAVLVLSFAFLLTLLNCGPDLVCWLVADDCVGAGIVPAISNDAIATARSGIFNVRYLVVKIY